MTVFSNDEVFRFVVDIAAGSHPIEEPAAELGRLAER